MYQVMSIEKDYDRINRMKKMLFKLFKIFA